MSAYFFWGCFKKQEKSVYLWLKNYRICDECHILKDRFVFTLALIF